MAIRARISTSSTIVLEDSRDNVIPKRSIGAIDLTDHRGTFDPKEEAYPDSFLHDLGIPEVKAAGVGKALAFRHGVGTPKDYKVQDLLAQVRIPNNPGFAPEDKYRQRVRSPLTAIRGFCMDCMDYSPSAVSKCALIECPFWALRLGKNTHRNRKLK